MANTFSFSQALTQESAPAAGGSSKKDGRQNIKYESLLETERHSAFQDFLKIIHEINRVKPTQKELEREGESLRRRLADANQDKLISAIYGAAGNPVAQVLATQAAQQADLLQYMFDAYKDNPKLYLAYKRAEMLEKIAPFIEASGQLTAAGGLSKADALSALGQYGQVGAMYAQANAARYTTKSGNDEGGVASVPWALLMQYYGAGGSESTQLYKMLELKIRNDKYLNSLMNANAYGL